MKTWRFLFGFGFLLAAVCLPANAAVHYVNAGADPPGTYFYRVSVFPP